MYNLEAADTNESQASSEKFAPSVMETVSVQPRCTTVNQQTRADFEHHMQGSLDWSRKREEEDSTRRLTENR
jgi:hypothetical protein